MLPMYVDDYVKTASITDDIEELKFTRVQELFVRALVKKVTELERRIENLELRNSYLDRR